MKRGHPPKRKAPLRSSAALSRSRAGLQSRKRLRARYDPQKAADEAAVRFAVFERDGWRCRLEGVPGVGPCMFGLSFQHRLKASQGGRFTVENGATLCVHHNTLIETDAGVARIAESMGLVIRPGRQPEEGEQ